MRVRIFLPMDDALEPFAFGEFHFDTMPQVGQVLRLADFEDAEYPVERVGFIQEDEHFVGAVWLGPPRPRMGLLAIAEKDASLAGDETKPDATID